MEKEAKILYYNHDSGSGIVITREKKKYDFYVASWNDFEALPEEGMLVTCNVENEKITSIEHRADNDEQTAQKDADSDTSASNDIQRKTTEKQKSITQIRLDVDVRTCVERYFAKIENDIDKRTGYKQARHTLDFLKMRRFLFTTYNNLTELDMNFVTPRIKAMKDDLLQMAQVYDDYRSKATYPEIAYEKVFLSRQSEYIIVSDDALTTKAKLDGLRETESRLAKELKEKEEVLDKTPRSSPIFEKLDEEHRALKGDYVDTVHMIAELDEEYRNSLQLLMEFEQRYKEEFFTLFTKASKKYKEQILSILNAQAYLFDEQLWLQAQKSKTIRRFFEKSNIKGEFCSKTYLKYYLNSLDETKISEEQRELFKLYDYLESIQHDIVLVVVNDIDDLFLFKSLFSKADLPVEHHIYASVQDAYAFLRHNRVSYVFVDRMLDTTSGESFVQAAKKKLGLRAKFIALYHNPSTVFDGWMQKSFRVSQFQEDMKKILKEER